MTLRDWQDLTPREREIMELLAHDGLTLPSIAKRLDISYHTVKVHVGNIRRKTGADKYAQLHTLVAHYHTRRAA